jgi:hypothetical protein
MKFKFIGNPGGKSDDRREITAFGQHFVIGVPVEVTDPRAIAKLSGNNHFAVVADDETPAQTEFLVEASAFTITHPGPAPILTELPPPAIEPEPETEREPGLPGSIDEPAVADVIKIRKVGSKRNR